MVHTGENDERSSDIESNIVEKIIEPFDIVSPSEENIDTGKISAGVVVPFTAQRDRLQRSLPEKVQTETVEKFQGGERDLIIISMVGSDPNYINKISEFISSPHRFNVAASRMKRKLVIIASESVFQTSHPDADVYENQTALKHLYQLIGALDESVHPVEEGTVQDISSKIEEDASFEVYHI